MNSAAPSPGSTVNASAATALDPRVIEYAASVVVNKMPAYEMKAKYNEATNAQVHFVGKLTRSGFYSLLKDHLKWIWEDLRLKPLVYNNTHGLKTHISASARKDVLVKHMEQFLRLPEASIELKPLAGSSNAAVGPPANAAAAAAAAASFPAQANQHQQLHYAAASMNPSYGQSAYNNSNNAISNGHLQAAYANYMASQGSFSNAYAATNFHGSPVHVSTNNNNAKTTGQSPPSSKSSRKRPSSAKANVTPSRSNKKQKSSTPNSKEAQKQTPNSTQARENNPWADLLGPFPAHAAAAAAATSAAASAAPNFAHNNPFSAIPAGALHLPTHTSPEDPHLPQNPQDATIYRQLLQMGFPDKEKVLEGIQGYKEQNPQIVPTADDVMLFMLFMMQRRDEDVLDDEEARQMDEARKRSEEDAEKLRPAHEEEKERRLLDASFQTLLHPKGPEETKLFFPNSWLLAYAPIKSLLEQVVDEKQHIDIKKSLIEVLKLEKNSGKWYNERYPRAYFTLVLGKRLSETPIDSLKKVLDSSIQELKNGMSLLSEQENGTPIIFIQAKKEDKENDTSKSEDDDDDVVIIEVNERGRNLNDSRKLPALEHKEEIIEIA